MGKLSYTKQTKKNKLLHLIYVQSAIYKNGLRNITNTTRFWWFKTLTCCNTAPARLLGKALTCFSYLQKSDF